MQPALAWIDLIMECRYTAGEVMNNGRKMMLKRGQLLGANLMLAARWNWTPKATRTWLAKLEQHGMISFGDGGDTQPSDGDNSESSVGRPSGVDESFKGRSKGRFANVLTVCNYGDYQLGTTEERQVEKAFEGRLRAGCGQVEGRSTYIENARAVTKEQDNKGTINKSEEPLTGYAPAEVRAPLSDPVPEYSAPRYTTLVVPPPRVVEPVAPVVAEPVAPIVVPQPPATVVAATEVVRVVSGELFGELPPQLPVKVKPTRAAKWRAEPLDALNAFERYNDLALRLGLAQSRTLTEKLSKAIRARLTEHGPESWDIALANIERSAFLRGKNNRSWRADLTFLVQDKSYTKLVDGGYGNGAHADGIEREETQTERIMRKMAEQKARLDQQRHPDPDQELLT
jgi:hypothetical protein